MIGPLRPKPPFRGPFLGPLSRPPGPALQPPALLFPKSLPELRSTRPQTFSRRQYRSDVALTSLPSGSILGASSALFLPFVPSAAPSFGLPVPFPGPRLPCSCLLFLPLPLFRPFPAEYGLFPPSEARKARSRRSDRPGVFAPLRQNEPKFLAKMLPFML